MQSACKNINECYAITSSLHVYIQGWQPVFKSVLQTWLSNIFCRLLMALLGRGHTKSVISHQEHIEHMGASFVLVFMVHPIDIAFRL